MGIEVFQAMGSHRVAKRCLELVSAVYELAQKIIQDDMAHQTVIANFEADALLPDLIDPFLLEGFALHVDSVPGVHPPAWSTDLEMEQPSGALEKFLQVMAGRCEE